MNVYEEGKYPFLKEENLFIKEAIKKRISLLGICLGAQLIAKALGAKVFKATTKEIGWYEIELTQVGLIDKVFSDFPQRFLAFQWHEDTFEIPEDAHLIATSKNVINQAFRYGRNVYALQFHLEVTKDMISEWIDSYDEEFKDEKNSDLIRNRLLKETETNIKTYKNIGVNFLKNFFST